MTDPTTRWIRVCGSSSWHNRPILDAALDRVLDELPRGGRLEVDVPQSGRGAARMAREWAAAKDLSLVPTLTKLRVPCDLVLVFHERFESSRFCRDMLAAATTRGVPWRRYDETSVRPTETNP